MWVLVFKTTYLYETIKRGGEKRTENWGLRPGHFNIQRPGKRGGNRKRD